MTNRTPLRDTLSSAPTVRDTSSIRWIVCFLLFLATTANYMDRSVLSLLEPALHAVAFMGWTPLADRFHQPLFDNNFGNIVICFQLAFGIGLLVSGRIIDRLGTRTGDKGYRNEQFVKRSPARRVVPHVVEYRPNLKWPSFLTEAERSSDGFRVSQQKRKRVEQFFGWQSWTVG